MSVRPGGLLIADSLGELAAAPRRALPRVSAAVLRQVPLFAALSERHLRKVAKLVTLAEIRAGVPVVREGAAGHSFYVILDGRAQVTRGGAPAATLEAGDYFGEMALLDRGPRSATVTAETALVALRISAGPFDKLLRSEPTIALALLQTLSARVRELERSL